jgi:hypothetical protein
MELKEYRRRRYFTLSHLQQVRMMLREGRYTVDCRRIITQGRRDLLTLRTLARA